MFDGFPHVRYVSNTRTGKSVAKYVIDNVNSFINEIKTLELPKNMVCYNIKKYKLDEYKELILKEMGF